MLEGRAFYLLRQVNARSPACLLFTVSKRAAKRPASCPTAAQTRLGALFLRRKEARALGPQHCWEAGPSPGGHAGVPGPAAPGAPAPPAAAAVPRGGAGASGASAGGAGTPGRAEPP